jgi:hypothetical protein
LVPLYMCVHVRIRNKKIQPKTEPKKSTNLRYWNEPIATENKDSKNVGGKSHPKRVRTERIKMTTNTNDGTHSTAEGRDTSAATGTTEVGRKDSEALGLCAGVYL